VVDGHGAKRSESYSVTKLWHNKPKGICAVTIIIVLLCTLSSVANSRTHPIYNESLVRAAVIFGILRFTSWPENFKPAGEIELCAIGASASANAIASLKTIPSIGQTTISYLGNPSSIFGCHALILGEGDQLDLDGTANALIICDNCSPTIMTRSAVILRRNDNKIQFEINLDRVEENKLSLSSSLIELASRCSSTNPAIRGCDD
jgi:hypothetical protein